MLRVRSPAEDASNVGKENIAHTRFPLRGMLSRGRRVSRLRRTLENLEMGYINRSPTLRRRSRLQLPCEP